METIKKNIVLLEKFKLNINKSKNRKYSNEYIKNKLITFGNLKLEIENIEIKEDCRILNEKFNNLYEEVIKLISKLEIKEKNR